MAVTENIYTGDGSTVLFSFTFPYLNEADIKVSLDGADTTAYTLANATTVQMNAAPANGVEVRVYRNSDTDNVEATFFPGSAIRAADLNENFLQALYLNQETRRVAQEATAGVIADGSISTAKLGSEVVTTDKLAASAVTEPKIATGAVTTAKLGAAAVDNTKLATNAVATTNIQDNAITNPKLGDNCVNTAELADSAVTNPKIADSAITQAKIGTNVLTPRVSEINGGPLAGMRNAIINGSFDHWQRGTSFSNPASSAFFADRWYILFNGTGATRTISQQVFTPGQAEVPDNPKYWLRFAQTVAGSGSTVNDIGQRIEGVSTFSGQQATLSFWAKSVTSGITLPQIIFRQNFGTGGSPSGGAAFTIASNIAVTTSWQKFSYTFTAASIAGKTIGTDGNDYIAIDIRMPLNATFTFDIAQVQLEAGPVATPFERRPIGVELALCQRYYVQYADNDLAGGVNQRRYALSGGAGWDAGAVNFPVQMRTNPTYSSSGTIAYTNASGLNITGITPYSARAIVTPTGAGIYVWSGGVHMFDAEL